MTADYIINKSHKRRSRPVSNGMKTFSEKVREVVRKIPKGRIMTYMEVAKKAGSPKAFRAVGSILSKNYDKDIPCHRVIRSDGGMGGYNRGGAEKKKAILHRESLTAR